MDEKHTISRSFLAITLIASFSLVFVPGLHGPFMFDDLSNITSNYYIPIQNLSIDSLYLAATSSDSGPLGRPVAMVSFALNYYFGEGFNDTYPFKLTNLVIHSISAFLIFFLFQKLFSIRKPALLEPPDRPSRQNTNQNFYISLVLSLIWLTHPIQANPVHYIVQRMTTLSGLFLILGLVSYLYGREIYGENRRLALFLLLAILPVTFVLGILSKENAVLMVPLIILTDFCFFRNSVYWKWLDRLDRKFLYTAILVLAVGFLWFLIEYALPGYSNREFTLGQRLLSETRILVFYLSLIFFPLINRFGLFHDYVPVSTSLVEPVTTILSILFLILVSVVSIVYRKKNPYLFFGWFWFLIAHSLESSFIALELVHEHRNYIPLIGPLFVLSGFFWFGYNRYGRNIFLVFASLIIVSVALVGYLRSDDWKSHEELILAESIYHPDSARAQGAIGSILIQKGHLQKGMEAMSRAYQLKPNEYGYLINMVLVNDMLGRPYPPEWKTSLVNAFGSKIVTPLSMVVLRYATTCAIKECRGVRLLVEEIAHACANGKKVDRIKRTQCLYYEGTLLANRGQYEQAIRVLRKSYNSDNTFLNPLFGIALAHLNHDRLRKARSVILELVEANKLASKPRSKDLQRLIELYNATASTAGAGLISRN